MKLSQVCYIVFSSTFEDQVSYAVRAFYEESDAIKYADKRAEGYFNVRIQKKTPVETFTFITTDYRPSTTRS